MRSRLLGSAAAALSAAFAVAADPVPVPPPVRPAVAAVRPAQPPEHLPPPAADTVAPPPRTAPQAPLPAEGMPALSGPGCAAGPGGCAPGAAGCDGPADRRPMDDHLGPWNNVWIRGGYAILYLKDAPVPTLAATGPNGPGSGVLLGNADLRYGDFSGLTLDGGMWMNEEHTFGVGLAGFLTEKRSVTAGVTSTPGGSPSIARPFFNPTLVGLGGQDALTVAAPNRFAGAVAVEAGARLAGAEANLYRNLCNTCDWTATLSAGFRYLDLDEYLTVYQVTQSLQGATIPFFTAPAVGGVAITDRVRTRNQFYGGQVGGEVERRFGPAFASAGVKVGLGPVHQVTEVGGTTVSGGAGGPGGFLAVGTIPVGNTGRTVSNRFAVLSDVHGMLGVQVSNRFRIGVGYQFLYLNTVARPGRQFDSTIDPRLVPTLGSFNTRIPPPAADANSPGIPPRVVFDRDDFFAHGVQFTIELTY